MLIRRNFYTLISSHFCNAATTLYLQCAFCFQITLVLQKIAIQTAPKPVAVPREHFLNDKVVTIVTGEEVPPSLDDIVHGVIFLDPKVSNIHIYHKDGMAQI